MSGQLASDSSVSPSLPLSDELRAAYQDLYDKLQAAAENTTDVAVLEALNAAMPQVDDILTKDRIYHLQANTALCEALLQQIAATNSQLEALQQQVASVASHFSGAGEIIAAVSKVFSFLPGA